MEDLEILAALNSTGLVGSVLLGRLRARFGGLGSIPSAPPRALQGVEGVGPAAARAIASVFQEGAGRRELARASGLGCRAFAPEDDGYPSLLRATVDHPILLYVRGELMPADALAVAIVGTRRPTVEGVKWARRISSGLASLGITVISGLARGIDRAAHEAALDRGRSVAVLGCGLAHIYPPEHRELAERIARRGAVVSEFPMGEPPRPSHFPRRNRIIAGMSLGTVCVEASMTSGALVTTDWALEQGREVFAVPGPAGRPESQGPHMLIRQGAKLVEGVADILEEIPELAGPLKRSRGIEPADPLQRIVLRALEAGAASLERLRRETGLRQDVAERVIDELVRAGRVRREGGGAFRRTSD